MLWSYEIGLPNKIGLIPALAFFLVMIIIDRAESASNLGSYNTYVRPPYVYLFAGKDPEIVERLDRDLRRIVPDMELHVGTRLPDNVQIELPLTRSEFAWLTRGRVPEWAGGIAYSGANRIVVKAPIFFEEGLSLEVIVAHEIAHILLHTATKGNDLPRWLNEGIAQVLAGESRKGSLSRLAQAALADRLMGLPRVESVLSFSSKDAGLAYAESLAATQGLVDRFGWENIRNILAMVASGTEFHQAFETSIGVEYDAWQAEWLESAQQRYRTFAFLDLDTIIWIVIMLLSLVAAFAVWLRKRQQFKRWALEEEELENEEENLGEVYDVPEQKPADDKPIHP